MASLVACNLSRKPIIGKCAECRSLFAAYEASELELASLHDKLLRAVKGHDKLKPVQSLIKVARERNKVAKDRYLIHWMKHSDIML